MIRDHAGSHQGNLENAQKAAAAHLDAEVIRRKQEEADREAKLAEDAARSAEAHRRAAELEAAYELELWKQREQV